VSYYDTFRTVHFASTRGACFMEERPRVILYTVAVARDGSLVQRAGESISSATTYDCVVDMEEKIEEAARRAAALLKAPPCKGGTYTVVLDPELAGVFAHEAFGHLSEADFLYENTKMRELMHLGREMGVKQLNIVDDGSLARHIATHLVDDEGTPTGKTYLIKEGLLAGHLHSLETAAKMNEAPTGNARAIRRDVPPIVRMTNTFVEGGELSFEDLVKDIDNGIYACRAHGGQTMMEMFTFSAAHAYRIEKGQVGELVRDVTLTGNVFETLKNMDGFGNDFRICEVGGGCGKGGQGPLPVTFGSPHLRIRNVVVGGK
jgi:TldD protein